MMQSKTQQFLENFSPSVILIVSTQLMLHRKTDVNKCNDSVEQCQFSQGKNTKKLDLTSLLYIFVDGWRPRVARSLLQIIITCKILYQAKEFQPVYLYLSYTYSSFLPGYEESTLLQGCFSQLIYLRLASSEGIFPVFL